MEVHQVAHYSTIANLSIDEGWIKCRVLEEDCSRLANARRKFEVMYNRRVHIVISESIFHVIHLRLCMRTALVSRLATVDLESSAAAQSHGFRKLTIQGIPIPCPA